MTRPNNESGEGSTLPSPRSVGFPEHKAARWKEYQERGGTWDYERWSNVYDANITKASEANAAADAYYQEISWGQREVTVDVEGEARILDIAKEKRNEPTGTNDA